MSIDDRLRAARNSQPVLTLPPPAVLRSEGNRRSWRRRAVGGAVTAACAMVATGLATQLPLSPLAPDPTAGPAVELILYPADTEVQFSEVVGTFSIEDGCLYFAGLPAVVPEGTEVGGEEVQVAGISPETVELGKRTKLGGVVMNVPPETNSPYVGRDQSSAFQRCADAIGSSKWILIT